LTQYSSMKEVRPTKRSRTSSFIHLTDTLDFHTKRFSWTIESFNDQPRVLDSQSFCVGGAWWYVTIIKRTYGISIFITLDGTEKSRFAYCSLQVINFIHRSHTRAPLPFYHDFEPGLSHGYEPLLSPAFATNGFVENDTMLIDIVLSTNKTFTQNMKTFFQPRRDDFIHFLREMNDSGVVCRWKINNWGKVLHRRVQSEQFEALGKKWSLTLSYNASNYMVCRIFSHEEQAVTVFTSVKLIHQESLHKSIIRKPIQHTFEGLDSFTSYYLMHDSKLTKNFFNRDALTLEIAFSTDIVLNREMAAFMIGIDQKEKTQMTFDEQVIHHDLLLPLGNNKYMSDSMKMSMSEERVPRSIVQFAYLPIHLLRKRAYMELTLIKTAQEVAIGLAPKKYSDAMTGWRNNSIGYHGDDGKVFNDQLRSEEAHFLDTFDDGDTVGLYYDMNTGIITFTKNGRILENESGLVFKRKDCEVYLCVTASLGDVFSINFGINETDQPLLWSQFYDMISNMRKNIYNCMKRRIYCDIDLMHTKIHP
jgi:hypothetical protein